MLRTIKSRFRFLQSIGTSEKGSNVDETVLPKKFKHLLIVFGGVKGLEAGVESDEKLENVQDPADLFDLYLNTCPSQVQERNRTFHLVHFKVPLFT